MKKEERAAQIWPILTLCATRRQTLTYSELGQLIGVPRYSLGQLLEPIQSHCISKQFPALSVLVVSDTTGSPGEGFIAASDVPGEQADVFKWPWLQSMPPTAEQLAEAVDNFPSNGKSLIELKARLNS